jgi:hypothetical protein
MNFEQQWIENDYNPFVVFNSKGKVTSLNAEAQFLLGSVSAKELFSIAQTYANVSFGFKTTFTELEFGRYKFFGLTVGYENEDEIGIKLYQMPSFKINKPKPEGELTNIYTLVDLCISTSSISNDVNHEKEYDPTIPEIIINPNEFIKLLNKMYLCVLDNDVIMTKIFYRVGEHIKFEDKKYSIFSLEIKASNIDYKIVQELKTLVQKSHFYIDIKDSLTVNIPMITS